MKTPDGYLYTKEHEWLRREGNLGVVGITAYASDQLGGVTFVELPDAGREVAQGEGLATVESVKAVSDVYAPAAGKVTEVNSRLEQEPELIDGSPYEDAWICKLTLAQEADLSGLMDAEAYRQYIDTLQE